MKPPVRIVFVCTGNTGRTNRPRRLSPPRLHQRRCQCDLILTATSAHKAILHHRHPDAAAKTFTMCEYAPCHCADIADAFGQDAALCRRVFHQIQATIEPILQRALGLI